MKPITLLTILTTTAPSYLGAQVVIDNANVVAGDVTINQTSANEAQINQASQQAIVDYNTFNIGVNGTVTFNQPNSEAAILNRIIGGDPTTIDGTITANGQLFFVNPAGMIFGNGASVSAESLIAVAGNITNENFLNACLEFDLSGDLVNNGNLQANERVILAGDIVENNGNVVVTDGASIFTAGADTVYIQDSDSGIQLELTNTGELSDSDTAITNNGSVEADEIMFSAGDVYASAIFEKGSTESTASTKYYADGADIEVAGTVTSTGGRIEIGGTDKGADTATTARSVEIAETAEINADGIEGGHIVVWSDGLTIVDGIISALGIGEGSGGYAELSGSSVDLDLSRVNMGSGGKVLIDPTSLEVVSGTAGVDQVLASDIVTALNGGTAYALEADDSVTITADIIATTTGSEGTLSINADANDDGTGTLSGAGAITTGGIVNFDAKDYSGYSGALSGGTFNAQLYVTGVTGADRVYDATTDATVSGGSITGFGADTLSLDTSSATASFGDKNVATDKSITVIGYAVDTLSLIHI